VDNFRKAGDHPELFSYFRWYSGGYLQMGDWKGQATRTVRPNLFGVGLDDALNGKSSLFATEHADESIKWPCFWSFFYWHGYC